MILSVGTENRSCIASAPPALVFGKLNGIPIAAAVCHFAAPKLFVDLSMANQYQIEKIQTPCSILQVTYSERLPKLEFYFQCMMYILGMP